MKFSCIISDRPAGRGNGTFPIWLCKSISQTRRREILSPGFAQVYKFLGFTASSPLSPFCRLQNRRRCRAAGSVPRADHAERSSAVQHQDLVGAADGFQPVGDHENGLVTGQGLNGLLQPVLVFRVHVGGGLVQNDDGGVLQPGPGNGDALPLTAGEGRAPPRR